MHVHAVVPLPTGSRAQEDANEHILEFARSLLDTRYADVTLLRGSSARHKRLLVSGLAPAAVYQKLQAAL